MHSVGTPMLWGGFAVVVLIMLAIDLFLQGRRGAHGMTMKQAAAWSLVWVTLSLLFNAAFWWYLVQTEGRERGAVRRQFLASVCGIVVSFLALALMMTAPLLMRLSLMDSSTSLMKCTRLLSMSLAALPSNCLASSSNTEKCLSVISVAATAMGESTKISTLFKRPCCASCMK